MLYPLTQSHNTKVRDPMANIFCLNLDQVKLAFVKLNFFPSLGQIGDSVKCSCFILIEPGSASKESPSCSSPLTIRRKFDVSNFISFLVVLCLSLHSTAFAKSFAVHKLSSSERCLCAMQHPRIR